MANPHQKTFVVKYKTSEGQILEGQFTTKRLSIMDRSTMGVRKSQLCGGMYCVTDDKGKATGQGIDENVDYLNTMIAHLEVALVQKPQWFDLEEIDEMGVLQEVYNEVVSFAVSFFRPDDGGDSQGNGSGRSSEATSDQTSQEQENNPHSATVVDREVSAALDA